MASHSTIAALSAAARNLPRVTGAIEYYESTKQRTRSPRAEGDAQSNRHSMPMHALRAAAMQTGRSVHLPSPLRCERSPNSKSTVPPVAVADTGVSCGGTPCRRFTASYGSPVCDGGTCRMSALEYDGYSPHGCRADAPLGVLRAHVNACESLVRCATAPVGVSNAASSRVPRSSASESSPPL